MSEVKKRRMIHLKVESNSSQATFDSSKMFHNYAATDEISVNDEPEIFYNFDSDVEVDDNPLRFSRSPSPASSTHSRKSEKDIFMLKDDLRRIANDPVTCTTTMNTILESLHNYFPWLPDNVKILKNKTPDISEPLVSNAPVFQRTVKTEQSSSSLKDGNIQYVMIENNELQEMKKNIEIIKEGQRTILKEFKSFRNYRPVRLPNTDNCKFELPFRDLEIFMKFDKDLLTDQEAKEQLIKLYTAEVEFDPKKYIKKILKKLFTTDVAVKFSFRGRQGNICAEKSNTIQILRDCTEQLYPDCRKDLFEKCATNYFYYIKDKICKAQKISKRNLQISDVNTVEFVLPFNEKDSFKSFDASIVKDPELAQQLKLMYLEETAVEYKRFLLNNFKKMFTDELANQLSFSEKGDLCIREFNVIKIMKECVLEKYNATNEHNFFNCTKQYLSFVKQKILESQKNYTNPTKRELAPPEQGLRCKDLAEFIVNRKSSNSNQLD